MFARALQHLQQRGPADSTDRRCIITTISWVLFTIVVISLVFRLALKLFVKSTRSRVGLDDFIIGLAMVSMHRLMLQTHVADPSSSSALDRLSL
jgi:hypothetical protein